MKKSRALALFTCIPAALALVALVIAAPSCGPKSPWIIQTQVADASLLSITAADSRHVWAVGGGPVYFYDGTSWTTQAEKLEAEPTDVSASRGLEAPFEGAKGSDLVPSVWAAGGDGQGIIWHFDGKAWSKQYETGDQTMSSVASAGTGAAWAAGTGDAGSNIYHFDGTTWSLQFSAPIHVQDLFARAPDDAWLVGEDKQGGSFIYRYDGSTWKEQYKAPAHNYFFGITALAGDSAWAVGGVETGGAPEDSSGMIFRYKGGKWSLHHLTPQQMHKVASADADHVWAAGGIGSNGPIYFYDGKSWTEQFDAHEAVFDIASSDARHAWAAGGLGGIFIYENTPY